MSPDPFPDAAAADDDIFDDPDRTADELIEAAAATPRTEGRLWRLQWARAFRRLAAIGAAPPSGGPGRGT
jgi:hypothetical protein